MRVASDAGENPAEAWVQLPWFGSPPQEGARIPIEYLGSDPGVARRAGAHDAVAILGMMAAIAGVGLAWNRLAAQGRRRRRFRR